MVLSSVIPVMITGASVSVFASVVGGGGALGGGAGSGEFTCARATFSGGGLRGGGGDGAGFAAGFSTTAICSAC